MREPTPWRFEDSGEMEAGLIRESVLNQSNSFEIFGEPGPFSLGSRLACWVNGWLPWGLQLGRKNGKRRLFRVW